MRWGQEGSAAFRSFYCKKQPEKKEKKKKKNDNIQNVKRWCSEQSCVNPSSTVGLCGWQSPLGYGVGISTAPRDSKITQELGRKTPPPTPGVWGPVGG